MIDPLTTEAIKAVKANQNAGIQVKMIAGDKFAAFFELVELSLKPINSKMQ
ncbi:MAG: hypothetical protein KME60_24590 [Cyanomargarita calcarea GSE-NOS-MK-12-04C]|jgi:hypothetical protein|uniref:Uncharacterized protein n=1 Tax=Cyanomargarita calcarea GSE-NOS-MK-12-04C TaxID=2839659 RepID=A0A951QSY4_9CYAN|nr:hypothetical protein [Cyanomargarita calcarea GSE-NOS-MK-12-04C]